MAKRISVGLAAATSGGQLEVAGGWRNAEVMLVPSFEHPLIASCPSRAVVLNCFWLVRLHTYPRSAHRWVCGTAGLWGGFRNGALLATVGFILPWGCHSGEQTELHLPAGFCLSLALEEGCGTSLHSEGLRASW